MPPEEELSAAIQESLAKGAPLDLREMGFVHGEDLCEVPGDLIPKIILDLSRAGMPASRMWLRGARFTDEVNLEGFDLSCPVVLEQCAFEGAFTLVQADISLLRLSACYFAQGIEASGLTCGGPVELTAGLKSVDTVDLSGARVKGAVDCTGGRFSLSHPSRPALELDGACIDGDLICGPGFHAAGFVSMRGIQVRGQLAFLGGAIENSEGTALSADLAKIGGGMRWEAGFRTLGRTRLLDAEVSGRLVLAGGTFIVPAGNALEASGLSVSGDLDLGGSFYVEGLVYLAGATIGGNLMARGGRIVNPGQVALHLDNVKVEQSVFLSGGFHATGEVRLVAARIGGQLACAGAVIENPNDDAFSADAAVIGTDLFMVDGFRVRGEVRLLGVSVGGQVNLRRGTVDNGLAHAVSADGLKVDGGVLFGQELHIRGGIRLNEARIGGQMQILGTQVVRPGDLALVADGMRVRGSMMVAERASFEGVAVWRRVEVGGELHMIDSRFSNPSGTAVLLDGSTIARDLQFNGVEILGRVEANGARVAGTCGLIKTKITQSRRFSLIAQNLSVGGNLLFRGGFTADSTVNLAGLEVAGQIACDGSRFHNPLGVALSLEGGSAAEVRLDQTFVAEGEVLLIGMRVKRHLSCARGIFDNLGGRALVLNGMQIGGSLYLSQGFHARGTVSALSIKVAEGFVCTDGVFRDPGGTALEMQGAQISGNLVAAGSFFVSGCVLAADIRVTRSFILEGRSYSASIEKFAWNLEDAVIEHELRLNPATMYGGLKLKGATIRRLIDDPAVWVEDYDITGLSYESLAGDTSPKRLRWWHKDGPLDARLTWMRGNLSGYQPRLYDQLAGSYERAGDDGRRRRVLVAKQRHRRPALTVPERLWSWMEDCLVGYGYRTWQALIPFVLLVVGGIVFFHGHGEEISQRVPTQDVPTFHSYAYTIDLLVPVVNLGQRENWTAHGDAQTVASILVVLGWVLTTAIIAALAGLVRRSD